MAQKTILLRPLKGKYVEITLEGTNYEIYRVHPALNPDPNKVVEGTPVPYEAAVQLLSMPIPIVTTVPIIKNGKYVSQIEEADQARINTASQLGIIGAGKSLASEKKTPSSEGISPDAAAIIAQLSEQNGYLKNQVESLTETVNKATAAAEAATASVNAVLASQAEAKSAPVEGTKSAPVKSTKDGE